MRETNQMSVTMMTTRISFLSGFPHFTSSFAH